MRMQQRMMTRGLSRRRATFSIYLVTFFVTLHYALGLYVTSSFLALYVPDWAVGIVYTLGSILAIVLLASGAKLLRRHGLYRTTLHSFSILLVATLLLAAAEWLENPLLALMSFFLVYLFTNFERFLLDEYMEEYSTDKKTGSLRGIFLTVMNVAIMLAPLAAGYLMGADGFWKVFLMAALMVAIGLVLAMVSFRKVPEHRPVSVPFLPTLALAIKRRDVSNIIAIHFLLQFFYAVMTIYTPIYLFTVIGFDWKTIGVVFAIMLSPFVLIELPLGWIADKVLGEKELLVFGFIVLALATATIPFLGYASVPLFAIVLFLTRIGAASIEIMGETYFFKQVNDREAGLISLFRNCQPFAYVVAPALATLFLLRWDTRALFWGLALFMLVGIYHSLQLKDTR